MLEVGHGRGETYRFNLWEVNKSGEVVGNQKRRVEATNGRSETRGQAWRVVFWVDAEGREREWRSLGQPEFGIEKIANWWEWILRMIKVVTEGARGTSIIWAFWGSVDHWSVLCFRGFFHKKTYVRESAEFYLKKSILYKCAIKQQEV